MMPRSRRTLRLAAAIALLGAQLLVPMLAFAEETATGSVRVEPGTVEAQTKFIPGLEGLADLVLGPDSTLTFFHAEPGTYDPEGPSPEEVAAAVESQRRADGDADFTVLKVYSVVEIDMSLYAVRYQSNKSLGITRNMVFDEVFAVNPDTGAVSGGGMMFIDPIYAMQIPDPDDGWRTAVGGIGAVAAAAAALAAAAASGGAAAAGAAAGAGASSGGKDSSDPNRIVGHVLQLNSRRIDVGPDKPARLDASIWKVHADGSYEAAPDCEVILGVPEGYSATPDRGRGSVSATITQRENAASPSWMAVYANGPGSGTTENVQIVGQAQSKIVWHLEPADKVLVPNGNDRATLVADVQLAPSAQAAEDLETVRNSLAFAAQGDWGETSEPTVWEGGARAVAVVATSPQPDRQLVPPSEIVVVITAVVGGVSLSETAKVPCTGLPELEVKPESLEFAMGCGNAFKFDVQVKNAAGAQWSFDAAWGEQQPVLGSVDLLDPQADRAVVEVVESEPDTVDPRNPRTVSTLVIKATAENFEDLERHIQVISVREGLFADTLNMEVDRTFHIAGDGSGRPTDIGFRAYVADPATGEIVNDPGLVRSLLIEPNDEEGSPARNAWEFAKFDPHFTEVRDTGSGPTGVYRFSTVEEIPGKTDRLPMSAWVSIPGRDKDTWGYDLRITLETPATAPGSPAWEVEYERCKKIIREFAPLHYQAKLNDILETQGRKLGAEGLAEMRKRIWYIAADLVLAEGAEGYKAEEAWANRIYIVLDWAQWAGDIAFGVVVGFYMGPWGAFAAQMLKPMMISALIAYREGQTPEQWLRDQLWGFTALMEGKIVDPDNFAKLPGSSKAKGWAIFCAYHFFKEYYYNGKTFVEAIKSVAFNVTEEVLAGWLNEKVRETGVPTSTTRPEDATIRQGDPSTVKPADGPDGGRPIEATRPVDGSRPVDSTRPVDTAPPLDGPAKPTEAPRPVDGAKPAETRPVDAAKPTEPVKPDEIDDWDAEARKWLGQDTETKPTDGEAKAEPTKPAEDAGDDKRKAPPDDSKKKAEPAPKQPDLSDTARTVKDNTYKGPDGRRYCDPETTLEIMRDPTRVRELKNAPPEVQQAFENTRRAIYEQHDAKVVDAVRHLPGMYGQRVKVLEFRTPGKGGSDLNTDRDFRVCYEGVDPVSGKRVWIEVPRQQWEGASHQAFAEATGGPRPVDPAHPTDAELADMKHWAESHQQLGTDKSHMEASIDFSDQGYVVNPTDGHIVRTQVTPNIELVKQGQSTLKDPDGLGRMFEAKVDDAVQRGHTAEGFAQARKGVEQLEGCRAGYEKQGYDVGELPPKMQETMDAVANAGKNSTDPDAVAAAQKALSDNGYKSLGDFMDKVSGQFSSLGHARK